MASSRSTELVGRENLIAASDCGLSVVELTSRVPVGHERKKPRKFEVTVCR
jgi:hypothetical protein